jgi:hypothetical protein
MARREAGIVPAARFRLQANRVAGRVVIDFLTAICQFRGMSQLTKRS